VILQGLPEEYEGRCRVRVDGDAAWTVRGLRRTGDGLLLRDSLAVHSWLCNHDGTPYIMYGIVCNSA